MIKYLVLLFNLIGLFIYQVFMQSSVTVTQTAPPNANPGSSFTVEVTINKGAASGFAKYQADLPQGFTATAVEKQGATVLSSGNAIKYIWASLPGDATLKISYTVTVDPTVSGNQNIGGKFLYVLDNVKTEADAAPQTITIGSGPAVASNNPPPSNQAPNNPPPANPDISANNPPPSNPAPNNPPPSNPVPNNPPPANPVPNNPPPSGDGGNSPAAPAVCGVFASRSLSTSSVAPGGSITVSVTVHKGGLAGFAKLEEKVPDGFTATEGNKGSASFTFVDGKMKLVWLSLPTDSVFTVTYNLNAGAGASGSQLLTGKFAFVCNGEAKPYQINGTSFTVSGTPIASNGGGTPPNNGGGTPPNNGGGTPPNNGGGTPPNNGGGTPPNNGGGTPPNNGGGIPNANGCTALYYVQVMALQNDRSVAFVKGYYKITESVDKRDENGLHKYVASKKFSEYKGARDHREQLKNGNGVKDAFVVAYNGGKRITVQEALMMCNQQWYQ
ncbi:MAG TPA: hypothetical protein VN922_13410 [Bacteroidia bacterium]|nr:hypothetical protein [Bacteroidia bacterium]